MVLPLPLLVHFSRRKPPRRRRGDALVPDALGEPSKRLGGDIECEFPDRRIFCSFECRRIVAVSDERVCPAKDHSRHRPIRTAPQNSDRVGVVPGDEKGERSGGVRPAEVVQGFPDTKGDDGARNALAVSVLTELFLWQVAP
jgi:hypothetical protein